MATRPLLALLASLALALWVQRLSAAPARATWLAPPASLRVERLCLGSDSCHAKLASKGPEGARLWLRSEAERASRASASPRRAAASWVALRVLAPWWKSARREPRLRARRVAPRRAPSRLAGALLLTLSLMKRRASSFQLLRALQSAPLSLPGQRSWWPKALQVARRRATLSPAGALLSKAAGLRPLTAAEPRGRWRPLLLRLRRCLSRLRLLRLRRRPAPAVAGAPLLSGGEGARAWSPRCSRRERRPGERLLRRRQPEAQGRQGS